MSFIRVNSRLFNIDHIMVVRSLADDYSQIVVTGGIEYEVEASVDELEGLIA